MEYTYTYDNDSARGIKNPIWWQSTVTSAGNLTSVIYRAFGQSFSKEDKRLLNVPFAQFVKLNTEFRHLWNMDKNNKIASRVALGALFAYGNATIAPYSEQFYVGGANSIRAFTVRSIGPGGYHPAESRYSYLDQTGTFRFEANVEYRFRIFKSIWGATFLDAGNVWLMRKDEARPNSQLELKTFPKQIALGTGVGIRYDMDILVFRLDFGIPLHLPYDTERSGYYNVTGSFIAKRVGPVGGGEPGDEKGTLCPEYISNSQKFMDEVRRERAVELSFEGFRFNDLQRWLLLTEEPYTIKTSQEFERVENEDFYKNNDPAEAEVRNFREETILKRVFGTKHYWFPLLDNDVYLYAEFPQNPGW